MKLCKRALSTRSSTNRAKPFGTANFNRGVAMLDRRFHIQSTGKPYTEVHNLEELTRRQTQGLDVLEIETPVYYLQQRWKDYGHYSHELCAQVVFWRDSLRPQGVKLLTIRNAWQSELLGSMGVSEEDIIDVLERFYAWDYPSLPTILCKDLYFSFSYEYAFSAICPELPAFAGNTKFTEGAKPKTRRIYAARTDTNNRRLVNEPQLISRLEGLGFEILVGSQISIADQVRAFAEAEIVVGKDGANLINVMFLSERSAFVEILSEGFFDPLYMRIANLRDVRYYNVLATVTPENTKDGRDKNSIVDVEEVVRTIARARCS
jgi:capsular polysaccharide biosynthesis protein